MYFTITEHASFINQLPTSFRFTWFFNDSKQNFDTEWMFSPISYNLDLRFWGTRTMLVIYILKYLAFFIYFSDDWLGFIFFVMILSLKYKHLSSFALFISRKKILEHELGVSLEGKAHYFCFLFQKKWTSKREKSQSGWRTPFLTFKRRIPPSLTIRSSFTTIHTNEGHHPFHLFSGHIVFCFFLNESQSCLFLSSSMGFHFSLFDVLSGEVSVSIPSPLPRAGGSAGRTGRSCGRTEGPRRRIRWGISEGRIVGAEGWDDWPAGAPPPSPPLSASWKTQESTGKEPFIVSFFKVIIIQLRGKCRGQETYKKTLILEYNRKV